MKMRKISPKALHKANNKILKRDWFRFYLWWMEKQKEMKKYVEKLNCPGIKKMKDVIDLLNSLPVKYRLKFRCYSHEREISATNCRSK